MAQILIIISFIIFNFPKSRIFLGDGGSYLFGGLISMNVINTSKLNPEISPFFFCVILFYLFYEVFFSFCRKALKKKSPVKPDSNHLHMLIFDKLQSLNIKNPNALTGLVINLVYFLLILPVCFDFSLTHENALFFIEDIDSTPEFGIINNNETLIDVTLVDLDEIMIKNISIHF